MLSCYHEIMQSCHHAIMLQYTVTMLQCYLAPHATMAPFLPGHAAVDAEVDRIGDADADVNHEDDVLGQVVVHELVHAA